MHVKFVEKLAFIRMVEHFIRKLAINYVSKGYLMILGLFYRNCLNFSDNTGAGVWKIYINECHDITHSNFFKAVKWSRKTWFWV